MPLISYNYASKNIDRMKKSLAFTAKVMLIFMIPVTVIYFFGAGTIISWFMRNDTIIAYGTRFMHGLCLSVPLLCVDFLAVGVFQACGFGKKSFIFAILRKIVLEIPALFILNYFFPLYGLAYAQLTSEAVLSVAAVIVVVRLFKKLDKKP